MNGCCSCFFFIDFRFIWKKNFRKTFQRLLGRIPRRVCDQLTFSMIQVSHIFWNFSKSARKVSLFSAKMIDLCLLTEENQTLKGVIGRNIALWQNLWVGVGRFERRSSSARASLALCGRFNQFRSPYSWITMRRALRKRRVFDFVPSYLNRVKQICSPGSMYMGWDIDDLVRASSRRSRHKIVKSKAFVCLFVFSPTAEINARARRETQKKHVVP